MNPDDRLGKSIQRGWAELSARGKQAYFPELLRSTPPTVLRFMAECLRERLDGDGAEAAR